jgi:hypothetical protein
VDDEKALEALQAIWNKIYGAKIIYDITLNDPVFSIVSKPIFIFIYVYFIDYFRRPNNEPATPGVMPWGQPGSPSSMLSLTQMISLTPTKPDRNSPCI